MIMVIALGGFTRFPTFFSPDGRNRLGFKSDDVRFNDYVKGLRGKFVAVRAIRHLHYRSRFVLGRRAINPELRRENLVPDAWYVYPDTHPDEMINNSLSSGILLKGTRKPVFVPLLVNRSLTRQEVDAILNVVKIRDLDFSHFTAFMEAINISYEIESELVDGFVIHVRDPEVRGDYKVLVSPEGRVRDVDFCVHGHEGMYLPEFVIFTRESGSVYHVGGFHY